MKFIYLSIYGVDTTRLPLHGHYTGKASAPEARPNRAREGVEGILYKYTLCNYTIHYNYTLQLYSITILYHYNL